jgi:hypothetical protein
VTYHNLSGEDISDQCREFRGKAGDWNTGGQGMTIFGKTNMALSMELLGTSVELGREGPIKSVNVQVLPSDLDVQELGGAEWVLQGLSSPRK